MTQEEGLQISLHDLLVKAVELESDRFSIQCAPTSSTTPAGLGVVLIGREAISDISQLLIGTAKGMGEQKRNDRLEITLGDSAHFILQWLVENGIPWTFSMFQFRDEPVMLFAFVGTNECMALCEPLTKLGCPTDLILVESSMVERPPVNVSEN